MVPGLTKGGQRMKSPVEKHDHPAIPAGGDHTENNGEQEDHDQSYRAAIGAWRRLYSLREIALATQVTVS